MRRAQHIRIVLAAAGLAAVSLLFTSRAVGQGTPTLAPESCEYTGRGGQVWTVVYQGLDCKRAGVLVRRWSRKTVPPPGTFPKDGAVQCSGKPVGRQPWELRCVTLSGRWIRAALKTSAAAKQLRDDLRPIRCPDFKDTSGNRWGIRIDDVSCATVRQILTVLVQRPIPATGQYSQSRYRLPMTCSGSPAGRQPTFISCVARNWARSRSWPYLHASARAAPPNPVATTTTTERTRP